jgi:hypothetical protein
MRLLYNIIYECANASSDPGLYPVAMLQICWRLLYVAYTFWGASQNDRTRFECGTLAQMRDNATDAENLITGKRQLADSPVNAGLCNLQEQHIACPLHVRGRPILAYFAVDGAHEWDQLWVWH